MIISGFTIIRNAIKYKYPVVQSIESILPICDEFIVNVGQSEDGTLDLIKSIPSPKIKIIETVWDMSKGSAVLAEQTNAALSHCKGDWAFYLQSDEVIHEADLLKLLQLMTHHHKNPSIDSIAFRWLHFYGSHYRYRIDQGWYQKQDRIIRNAGYIESTGDAFAFHRKDGQPLRRIQSGCLLYHYGWVNEVDDMGKRAANAKDIGYGDEAKGAMGSGYGDLNRFPVYFGSHPDVMKKIIDANTISRRDRLDIALRYWWHPFFWLRLRYKTGRRVKERIT